MSWGVCVVGRAPKVAEAFAEAASNNHCVEPEEGFKQMVADLVERVLASYPDASAVRIAASGSQTNHQCPRGKFYNTLKLEIEPMWGFVE